MDTKNLRYKVIGYDKDADVEEVYLSTNDKEDAILVAEILGDLTKWDLLLRQCSDGTTEPIDWVYILDVVDEETIWISTYDV